MHYALTVLDKSNGTQSDAGPINAGATTSTLAWHLGYAFDETVWTLDEAGMTHEAAISATGRALRAAIEWAHAPHDFGASTVVPVVAGYGYRVAVHGDDCDCED